MTNQKVKIAVLSGVVLIAGYALGAFVGWPNSQDELLSGNVGKASRYKKDVASPELKAFEQQLKSDEQFRSQTVFSLAFINSRTGEFKENALMSAEASSDISEMSQIKAQMEELAVFATNAEKASGDALEALNTIMTGESGINYEELSNNAVISFMLLDKGLSIAQEYVSLVDAFLVGKKMEDYRYLAFTRDQWANYSTLDAVLSKNKEMLAYWEGKDYILSPDATKTLVASLPEQRQYNIVSSGALNMALVGELRGILIIPRNNEILGLLESERYIGFVNSQKLDLSDRIRAGYIMMNAGKLGLLNSDKLEIIRYNTEVVGSLQLNMMIDLGSIRNKTDLIQFASVLKLQ